MQIYIESILSFKNIILSKGSLKISSEIWNKIEK